MADTYIIDLRRKIPEIRSKNGTFRFIAAETTVARCPLVLIRYSKDGIRQEHGVRMDMDKKALLDNFDSAGQDILSMRAANHALLRRTPMIWSAIAAHLKG